MESLFRAYLGGPQDAALIADIRLMARGAKLSAAFVKRGILPESGGTWLLPRLLAGASAAIQREIGYDGFFVLSGALSLAALPLLPLLPLPEGALAPTPTISRSK